MDEQGCVLLGMPPPPPSPPYNDEYLELYCMGRELMGFNIPPQIPLAIIQYPHKLKMLSWHLNGEIINYTFHIG